uniref:Ig-like domain-containing protein n=1 Tax=Branchiostoma floridae TaxID=7739 RepID=C3Y1F3_BRAFL|eukprot:XP_002609683.1 hypothetical protein BRAFLDRAFT_83696 [Branchiostoma floridae]
MAVTPQFSVADYAVFAVSLLISAGIGLYYALTGGKQRTTQEFLMADRKMSAVPVAMSLMASFCSAIALLGQPAEAMGKINSYDQLLPLFVMEIMRYLPGMPGLFVACIFRHMANCCLGAKSREDKNKRILHLLPSRSDRDFGVFCAALRTDDQSAYLADLLEGEGVNLNTRIMEEEAVMMNSNVQMQSTMKANGTTVSNGEGMMSGIQIAPFDPAQVIAPKFTVEPKDVVFNPAGTTTTVSFQCTATGDPAPQYLWFKQYVDLDSITRQPPYQTSGGTLTIPTPTAADQGRYWCQAYNEYGRVVSVGANLTFAFPQSPPQLVLFETVQYKKRGDNVLMEFFAYGNPTPTLGWRRVDAIGGNPMEFPPSAKYEQWNRAMTLTNVALPDQGFYEVTATNSQGTDVKTAQLIIEDVPQYIKKLETQNLDLAPGEDINLEVTWQDDGRNPVTPTWYYNGADVVPDGTKYIVDNSSPATSRLTVKNAQPGVDSGSYQSILENQYGLTPSFSEVRVGAPAKVADLKLVEKGDNSPTLSWSEPQTKAELDGYQIQYYPTDNPDNVQYMDLLFCCCCKGWCAGKKKEKALGKGQVLSNLTPMSRVHQEMLRTYRTTIVDNMKVPGKVTARMANEKVINANMVHAIARGAGQRYLIDATAPQGSLMSASSTVVAPGQPVILEVRGEVDQVEWLYNGSVIKGDPGITTNSDGFLHELHIDRMSPERDGTYTCRGETPDGGAVACDIKVQTLI